MNRYRKGGENDFQIDLRLERRLPVAVLLSPALIEKLQLLQRSPGSLATGAPHQTRESILCQL